MGRSTWKVGILSLIIALLFSAGAAFAATLGGPTVSADSALSTGVPPGSMVPSSHTLYHPQVVTLADNGDPVEMPVGASFLLKLGGPPPDWQVTVGNPSILSRVIGVMVVRGAQGIYRAKAPGRTWLQADGTYPCQFTTPKCLIANRAFRINVVVTGTPPSGHPAMVNGRVTRIVPGGVLLQTVPLGPICPPNAACPRYAVSSEQILVRLKGTVFDNAAGQPVPTPVLGVGEELAVSGSLVTLTSPPSAGIPRGTFSVITANLATLLRLFPLPLQPGASSGS